jgi:hypothetical protein
MVDSEGDPLISSTSHDGFNQVTSKSRMSDSPTSKNKWDSMDDLGISRVAVVVVTK